MAPFFVAAFQLAVKFASCPIACAFQKGCLVCLYSSAAASAHSSGAQLAGERERAQQLGSFAPRVALRQAGRAFSWSMYMFAASEG